MDKGLSPGDPRVASSIVMVSPEHFCFNPEAAESNAFANREETNKNLVLGEFKKMVEVLKGVGIEVFVLPSPGCDAPDAVFPNNWFSTHRTKKGGQEGEEVLRLVLYPMLNPNRSIERRNTEKLKEILLSKDLGRSKLEVADCGGKFEEKSVAVEGTGVLIFDRFGVSSSQSQTPLCRCFCVENGPRADPETVRRILRESGVMPNITSEKKEGEEDPFVFFSAADEKGVAIYHTNVMMAIGSDFAVVCEESVTNPHQLQNLRKKLFSCSTSREIVNISHSQVKQMCGNVLELRNTEGQLFVLMSGTAFRAFTQEQKEVFQRGGREIVTVNIPTIERIGGGSARCMVAEIF
uniref:Amidinotransferase n=1 Tax=Paramoeba aestuarina TaxID=180227 RepID=A0A7S4PLJ6_9EUKA|mmetsp:Transcript_773/g.1317  ORF Transcript_773/g.1317 Transcript_773/m.1317 type:complete len:350 (+) Transcript_773:81-1130(+)